MDRYAMVSAQAAKAKTSDSARWCTLQRTREPIMSSDDRLSASNDSLTVYYDGACPLCRREINVYRKMNGAEDISWVDVAKADTDELGPGLTPQLAQKRFHVRTSDGQLESGSAAFAKLWIAIPSLSWLGSFTALPGVRHLADVLYSGFLVIRPAIQRMMPR